MIVKWTQVGVEAYTVRWQGKNLLLVLEDGTWRCYVDGERAKQRWPSPRAAMNGVDAVMCKIVTRLAGTVKAGQRPLTTFKTRALTTAKTLAKVEAAYGQEIGQLSCARSTFLVTARGDFAHAQA